MKRCELHPEATRDAVLLRCVECEKLKNPRVAHGFYGELLCQNPLESWRMTRSLESMRMEYEILHVGSFTDEEILRITATMRRAPSTAPYLVLPIMGFIVMAAFLAKLMFN